MLMTSTRLKIVLCTATLTAAAMAQGAAFEEDIRLSVRDLFPDVALVGSNYKVEDAVSTDGFLTKTVIDSDFGQFTAIGPGMLHIRLHEIGGAGQA